MSEPMKRRVANLERINHERGRPPVMLVMIGPDEDLPQAVARTRAAWGLGESDVAPVFVLNIYGRH